MSLLGPLRNFWVLFQVGTKRRFIIEEIRNFNFRDENITWSLMKLAEEEFEYFRECPEEHLKKPYESLFVASNKSVFQDFESYLRTEVNLSEEVLQSIMNI